MAKQPSEIIKVQDSDSTAVCDGGGGALGHPQIYLRFDGKPAVDCYYCGRRFVKPSYQGETPASA
ncbi:MAG: zinc-finger domain-containing protein [Gammaproteobacteria bacterium]|nr:zinc-finger domain-containing protein [Gammaproteobacteria bacterium]